MPVSLVWVGGWVGVSLSLPVCVSSTRSVLTSLWCGCAGGGVCQILKQNAGLIAARCGGRAIELAAVADIVKPEGVDISGAVWYDDAVQMAKEADVDVVVETIGGYGVALT